MKHGLKLANLGSKAFLMFMAILLVKKIEKNIFIHMVLHNKYFTNRIALLVVVLLLIISLFMVFYYLNETNRERNKNRTCIKKVEIHILWNVPKPHAIGAYIVTYDPELIEAVKQGYATKVRCVSKFLDSVDAHGADLTLWTDTTFYVAHYADLSFVANENQRLKLERSHQTDFYYEITNKKGKTWVIEPCQKSLASSDKK